MVITNFEELQSDNVMAVIITENSSARSTALKNL
jgi:hypothetical protein